MTKSIRWFSAFPIMVGSLLSNPAAAQTDCSGILSEVAAHYAVWQGHEQELAAFDYWGQKDALELAKIRAMQSCHTSSCQDDVYREFLEKEHELEDQYRNLQDAAEMARMSYGSIYDQAASSGCA